MSRLAAIERQHPFVLDTVTGEPVSLDEFLGDADYGTVVGELRVRLAIEDVEGRRRYVCPVPGCGDAMVLKKVAVKDKSPHRFYFKHRHRENQCAGTHHLPAAAIAAIKFNGAKESQQHIAFKQRIVESLLADPGFSDCITEKRWVDVEGGRWRQPDVQATRGGRRIAFEVQLSTTFLHVIAERMKFYRDNNGVLLWLFRDLDFSRYLQAEDDVFYANNRNAFRVTDETVALSKEAGKFALECAWMEPVFKAEGIHEEQKSKVIFFDELRFDVGRNGAPRIYYFNNEEARARVDQVRPMLPLIQRFERYWLKQAYDPIEWSALREQLRRHGVTVPEYQFTDPFMQLLNMLYSVKHGRMLGYNYKDRPFAALAHHLFDRRKAFLRVFHLALLAFDRIEQVRQDDQNGSLERKAKGIGGYLHRIKRREAEFDLPSEFRPIVALLFPELKPDSIF